MTTETSDSLVPTEIESIGKIHFIGGIFNVVSMLIATAIYLVSGLFGALFIIGAIVWCCVPFSIASAVIGGLEIASGSKHQKHVANPGAVPLKKSPKTLAILQIVFGVLALNVVQIVLGILVITKVKNPEVAAYYESQA